LKLATLSVAETARKRQKLVLLRMKTGRDLSGASAMQDMA
jgi:hypothetical protein